MLSLLVSSLLMVIFNSFWSLSFISMMLLTLLSLFLLYQNFFMSLNMLFMETSLSSLLIFLSLTLCLLSLVSTPLIKSTYYSICLILLTVALYMAFSSSNLLSFYIFFEASLIPTLILIICWGYQPERLQAGTYMMLYTVSASLPLLFLILLSSSNFFSLNISILSSLVTPVYSNLFILFLYGAFLVKLPIYSVHLWLPKAHVEAPLAGSMILAGILLKLGGFGLYLMNKCFSLVTKSSIMLILISLSIWGGVLACIMCLRQSDMKALVAYSSVAHMSLVVVGFLMNQSWGVLSAVIMMFAHGVTSSALFCMTYFTYEKVNTRSMTYMKGLLQLYPMLSFFWFTMCCINMAAPPTLNLMSELLIIPCLWTISLYLIIVMGFLVFFSALYNMYLYTSLNHGCSSSYCLPSKSMKSFEITAILLHILPLFFIFKSELFLFLLEF